MYRHLVKHSCLFSLLDGGFEIHRYCCLQRESIHSHCGMIYISLYEYTPRLRCTVLLTGIQAAYTSGLLRMQMLCTFIHPLNEHMALALYAYIQERTCCPFGCTKGQFGCWAYLSLRCFRFFSILLSDTSGRQGAAELVTPLLCIPLTRSSSCFPTTLLQGSCMRPLFFWKLFSNI